MLMIYDSKGRGYTEEEISNIYNYINNEDYIEEVIAERDEYHEVADKLSQAIANYFNEDIGEHSNLNNPWQNALNILKDNG